MPRAERHFTRGSGWIRPNELKIIDFAYNDAGGPIPAGQGASVPEPSALALLAPGLGRRAGLAVAARLARVNLWRSWPRPGID